LPRQNDKGDWGQSKNYYIFIRNDKEGVAFIGSSNLSESALIQEIEWNICIDSSQTPSAFLLGLTATPERSDGRDIQAFCDNNVAFRFDLTEKSCFSSFKIQGSPA